MSEGHCAELVYEQRISFVISSVGTRDEFIDEHVIPSILKQGIDSVEIVITGRYQGVYLNDPMIHYVPAREFPIHFYKHFQQGFLNSTGDWIVDLDDDMTLTDHWYRNLVDAISKGPAADIYGFRLLNPEGTLYADMGKVFGLKQSDHQIRPTSYFGCYIAKRRLFKEVPYPTYMSGDRHHGLLTYQHGFSKRFLPDVQVIHHGTVGAEGGIARALQSAYDTTTELRRRLGMLTRTNEPRYETTMRNWWRYAGKLEKKRKRIGIWGWFGHGNVGDELILDTMVGIFEHHLVSVYTDSPGNVQVNHGNVEGAFSIEELRRQLNDLDLLLVGGGGVLHNKAITNTFPKELMRQCETPLIVYAAGIPFFEWCHDLYYFLSRCYLVTLRDRLCLDFIQRRYRDIPAQLLPDPAFTIPGLPTQKVPGKVVLNIRALPEGWRAGLPEDVNEILGRELGSIYHYLASKDYSPLVLGFEQRDEGILSNQGYNYRMVDFKEAIEEIASAELLIGTRYHSGIIAITQRTPAILINYQKKVKGLETLISDGINIVDVESLDLIREFEAFHDSKDQHKNEYSPEEIEALSAGIREFNRMYIDYDY